MKQIILIGAWLVAILLILTGCATESISETNNRFVLKYSKTITSNEILKIFYDEETKVQYLFIDGYKAGGLTVLLDAEGKPLLYEGE